MSDQAQAGEIAPCPDEHRASFVTQMRMVPGPVAIICAANGGKRSGLAATAWNSLCADPPMLLVCVNKTASAHDIIAEANAFSLNLLPTTATETVSIFSAQRGLSGADRFLKGQWTDGALGQPLLEEAVVAFECKLEASHAYGTHTIYIGKVNDVRGKDGESPMIYLNGEFCRAEPLA